MLYDKSDHSLLIVCSSEKSRDMIHALIAAQSFSSVTDADCGAEARQMMLSDSFDLVIINTPLSDEYGHELALDFAERTGSGVILLTKNEQYDELSYRVGKYGVVTLPKPIYRPMFEQSLQMLSAVRRRLYKMEEENAKLKVKMEEIRRVDMAKCLLIESLGMTEAEAHRYIEKRAMDTRAAKVEVADSIIKTYKT